MPTPGAVLFSSVLFAGRANQPNQPQPTPTNPTNPNQPQPTPTNPNQPQPTPTNPNQPQSTPTNPNHLQPGAVLSSSVPFAGRSSLHPHTRRVARHGGLIAHSVPVHTCRVTWRGVLTVCSQCTGAHLLRGWKLRPTCLLTMHVYVTVRRVHAHMLGRSGLSTFMCVGDPIRRRALRPAGLSAAGGVGHGRAVQVDPINTRVGSAYGFSA